MAMIGFIIRRRAGKSLGSYFLGERSAPFWTLGLTGYSSDIDIGGTMSMVGTPFISDKFIEFRFLLRCWNDRSSVNFASSHR